MRKQKGITLIALVITIIVLLILAGVTLQSIMGDDGIANRAISAKEKTEISQEIEQVKLAYSGCKTDNLAEGEGAEVSVEQLQNAMDKAYGSGTVEVSEYNSKLIITYSSSGRTYEIDNELGEVKETLDWEEIFATEQKHPDQVTSQSIGIAADGTPVNLDLWDWCVYGSDSEICLNKEAYSYTYKGYIGEYIDGKIIGKVPMYILDLDGSSYREYLPVTSMYNTFYGATELIEAPEIPSTVRNMSQTFDGCINLEKAPEIPNSVEDMNRCFDNCSSLTGNLVINANPDYYSSVLYDAATNEGCDLILTGSCSMLEEILATKSENSNIRIGN